MSLGIAIKSPEGIVLAAESRVTLSASVPYSQETINVNFDNVTKVLSLYDGMEQHNHVGFVTYGQATIGSRTAQSFMPEFEEKLAGTQRLSIEQYAHELSGFFTAQWNEAVERGELPQDYNGADMAFVIGGFDENAAYGRVFQIDIPGSPMPREHNSEEGLFGFTWGGQREVMDKLVQGYDERLLEILFHKTNLTEQQITDLLPHFRALQMQIPLTAMPLQDVVDLAIFFIRTTITAQTLTIGIRGCGGPIDVATITRSDGLRWIQRKELRGERDLSNYERRL